jgi:hypothetical protein
VRTLFLLVWLPCTLLLFPLPPQAAAQLMDQAARGQASSPAALDSLVSALWFLWVENLVLMLLGLCVGVLAWRRHRYWQPAALAMSLLYLALIAPGYFQTGRAVPDGLLFFETESSLLRTLQLDIRLIESGLSKGSVIGPARIVYGHMLMPAFQLIVLGSLLWLYGLSFTRRHRR